MQNIEKQKKIHPFHKKYYSFCCSQGRNLNFQIISVSFIAIMFKTIAMPSTPDQLHPLLFRIYRSLIHQHSPPFSFTTYYSLQFY